MISKRSLIFCILFLSFFVGYTQSSLPVCGVYSQFYNQPTIDITTFGASTVEGTPKPFNFQDPLRSFLENCYSSKPVNIENFGIGGETTAQGLLRFDAAIAQKTGFLLLLMGSNDVIQIANGSGSVTSTVDNMRSMIRKAKANNLNVIVGTLQYFVEISGRTPEALLSQRRNRITDALNTAYKTLARLENVRIADINRVIGKNKALYVDNIHPNRRGYYILALVWFDAINQEISTNYQISAVLQNYPNPANASTTLGFNLSGASRVRVTMFNSAGQRVYVVFEDLFISKSRL
ncbi:MAG: SGNH/GDSL hydrolase family protein [Pedobacter sp.]|nr:MAG: SGNH/GDSL hydrolase family protein [Pedobacter sp.]